MRIQLPDELYKRAKRFADSRELPLAEIIRRGLELFLERYPLGEASKKPWKLPTVNGGGIKVPLDQMDDFATGEHTD